MDTIVKHVTCPDYQFDKLDIAKVSNCIDRVIIEKFSGNKIVLRGIQSEKHNIPKEQSIQQILQTGTDRNESGHINARKVNDIYIDLFGFACEVKSGSALTLSVLEGFHKWKPMSLEQPQRRVDIWMIYDASQLDNVEYTHGDYNVKARDGYIFKNPKNKSGALVGLIVID